MSLPTVTRQYVLPKIGSYENLVFKEAQVGKPRSTEVLIKIHAVSLQYRDLMVASGRYMWPPSADLVPCSDMAGEIVAVGEDVKGWKVGDRVCANFSPDHIYGDTTEENNLGAYGAVANGVLTEYKTFPAHALVAIPAHFSYEEASTLPCAALTAYNSLYGAVPIKAGDSVLVLGSGGVSIFGLQFAKAAGATVIATSSSDEKLDVVKKLGADHVINYKKNPEWQNEVLKLTGGRGVDHVLEVGGGGTLPKSISSTRIGGLVHVIGFLSSKSEDQTLVPLLIGRAVTVRGILIGSVAQFRDMNRLITANPEVTRPVIDKVFSFEDAKEAFQYLESQKHVGKVVIKVA